MSILEDIANETYEMEMTPMIDVTFLLLIFFILTLKFKVLEGKLAAYLPKDVGVNQSEAEIKEKIEIVVRVVPGKEGVKVYATDPNKGQPWRPSQGGDKDRRFTMAPGSREVEYAIGARKYKDVLDVRSRLKELFKQDPERPSTIDARPGTYYADVVPVLDATIEAGYTDITFIGEYKQ